MGCSNHTYRYYEFESDMIVIDYGSPGAVLAGKFIKVSEEPQITNFGNPYYLMISFRTKQEGFSPNSVKNIEITSRNGDILYKFDGGEMETSWSNDSKDWFSSWSFKDLELEHIPLTIKFNLIFNVEGDTIIKSITEELKPKYKEEKSNDFIDGIMGV